MQTDDWCKILKKRIVWIKNKNNLGSEAKIFVNFRDFCDAMFDNVEPILKLVAYLSSLDLNLRPFGLLFEEARGTYMPEEVGRWCGGMYISPLG